MGKHRTLTIEQRIEIAASRQKLLVDPKGEDDIKRLMTLGANLASKSWRKYLASAWIEEYLQADEQDDIPF